MFTASFDYAANQEGEYTVLSEGAASCGRYIEAVEKAGRGGSKTTMGYYHAYLDSYFTGVNRYLSDTKNIKGNTDSAGVRAYVQKYCRENPLKDYMDAIIAVVNELYPNRTK
ncbi:hypothetical protein H2508_09820 [Parahaliea sp. F7430]|uniref:Uncharacterized protein n=1 Tax=Sediminihaliea albiluteola TaxID=2758564 RepID=A0A7W2YK77_9GAMM|nr:hypothetical protein [Sediminihaliea albiluteola]MBA6413404.1 hypothetical protein [Sediminihaliea albiluteola]